MKQEEPEFSLITGSLLPQRPPLTDPERGQEEEEEEGTVAVRANMDLALPNSTGQYSVCVSECSECREVVCSCRFPEWAWLEGTGEEIGRRGCGFCCRGEKGCGFSLLS